MSDLGLGPVFNPVVTASKDRATFYGTSYHKVSGRNQVALPRHQQRVIDEAQEGQLLLMRWQQESFLRLYTKKQFDKKLDEVKQNLKFTDEQKFSVVESLAGNAEAVEPDTQGRFVLPAQWVEALNIKEEVAFCGAGNFIKIWPAERKREAEKAAAEEPADVKTQVTNILNA